jgi:hypothetical protein
VAFRLKLTSLASGLVRRIAVLGAPNGERVRCARKSFSSCE